MNITYREISQSDYPFLREMLYEALFVPDGEKPFDKAILDIPEISKYIDNWEVLTDFGLIIQENDEFVGAVWGRLFMDTNKGYGFVDNNTPELSLAIKSNYRNRGLGTGLMIKFLQCAKDKGYHCLSLSVDKRSRAFGFYKKLGFKVVEEFKTAYTMKMQF